MIKALIFDLDGTLADTETYHYYAWRDTLLANGVEEFSFPTFLGYVGTSNEKVAGDYIQEQGLQVTAIQLIAQKQQRYKKSISQIELYPGVWEILERYRGDKMLAVASSSHSPEVNQLLEEREILSFFSVVLTGDMVKKRKPDPEIYLQTSSALGVEARTCVAFEDSIHGLAAAKNAGMIGIAVPNRFTREHDFSRADRIIDSLESVDDEMLAAL